VWLRVRIVLFRRPKHPSSAPLKCHGLPDRKAECVTRSRLPRPRACIVPVLSPSRDNEHRAVFDSVARLREATPSGGARITTDRRARLEARARSPNNLYVCLRDANEQTGTQYIGVFLSGLGHCSKIACINKALSELIRTISPVFPFCGIPSQGESKGRLVSLSLHN